METLETLFKRGYKQRLFTALNRQAGKSEPVGVALFERRGQFYESVIYERFGQFLYTVPAKQVREVVR